MLGLFLTLHSFLGVPECYICWFNFQEHLLIVCELLKANLYEFHKFNRESGGEVYFTMPRLQVCVKPILFSPRYVCFDADL